ncbi:MAG: hypothetical protein ACOC22_03685 [bacterium]
MAAIDKTYVSYDQYLQVVKFFTPEMKAKQKQDLGYYFGHAKYNKSDFKDIEERVLWNTSTLVDLWLAQNCKLDFIQERLKQQYGDGFWMGWRELDFSKKGFIISIRHNKSYVSPFKNVDEEFIDVYNKFLVYGTTYFHKFLFTATALIRGESYNVLIKDSFDFVVEYELFGLHFKAVSNIFGTKYYVVEESENQTTDVEVGYGYFPIPTILLKREKDDFLKFFIDYKIKHSYSTNEYKKYEPEQIIMSGTDECFSVDMYKDFSYDYFGRYFMFLPKYIESNLK